MMNSRTRARCLVITGQGKGKTTAAAGIIVRSLAARKKVLIVRFTKAVSSGETDFFSTIPGVEVLESCCGMTPPQNHPEFPRHALAAQKLFARAVAAAPRFDLVVLDEICGVTARGMVEENDVVALVKALSPAQTIVLTGRGAGVQLIAAADTVSEILNLKHGWEKGIDAQQGVEF